MFAFFVRWVKARERNFPASVAWRAPLFAPTNVGSLSRLKGKRGQASTFRTLRFQGSVQWVGDWRRLPPHGRDQAPSKVEA